MRYYSVDLKNIYTRDSLHTALKESLGLPEYKMHCSVLAEEAIQKALEDYYTKHPEKRPET